MRYVVIEFKKQEDKDWKHNVLNIDSGCGLNSTGSISGTPELSIIKYLYNLGVFPVQYTLPEMLPKIGWDANALGKYGRELVFRILCSDKDIKT